MEKEHVQNTMRGVLEKMAANNCPIPEPILAVIRSILEEDDPLLDGTQPNPADVGLDWWQLQDFLFRLKFCFETSWQRSLCAEEMNKTRQDNTRQDKIDEMSAACRKD